MQKTLEEKKVSIKRVFLQKKKKNLKFPLLMGISGEAREHPTQSSHSSGS